ncbi:MAG: hypothetical protein AB7O68_25955 [Pirellulales bacterium]
MLVDKNRAPLEVGDLVTLRCRVVGGHEGTAGQIVLLEPADKITGPVYTRTFGVNSRQVEAVTPRSAPAKPAAGAGSEGTV